MKLTETILLPIGYIVSDGNLDVTLRKFSKVYNCDSGGIFWQQAGNVLMIFELDDED